MRADELREKYLVFFESKGCVRRPSDVLVPRWDPSVLFTPAGMNQFKDHFLGKVKLDFTRATTCQKCLRTGDIDNVGRTPYHHTFFEMLGNFSFGDYFKREAIQWAWEFLTDQRWLAIDEQRLSVTVYHDDQEAADIWLDGIGLSTSRVRRLDEDENFWPAHAPSRGPDGVCGPCSEIYFRTDSGAEVEIWNLVFTQFNRVGDPPDNLRPLPSKNIDTGMGLERTASVLQGVTTNFHIDILLPLVEAAAEVCGLDYDAATDSGRRLRRIADHVRACSFCIHENVTPGPKEEKYVVRQLLRRAVLDGRQLGLHEPFLHQLVDKVAELMRGPYPELSTTANRVSQVIRGEESNFFATIDSGLARIERIFDETRRRQGVMIGGEEIAEMYTTHGFPPELFEQMAAEHNLTFDWEGFGKEMERHGVDSGAGRKKKLFEMEVGALDRVKRAISRTEFVGYDGPRAEAQVVAILAQDHSVESLDEVGHERPVELLLNRTPFYGEGGGQVGDTGQIIGEHFQFDVIDTQRSGDFMLHQGHLRQGKVTVSDQVQCEVDQQRRAGIRRAHSATHMLHHALQKHLGSHAQQQGSKVDVDWLRFDFSHPASLSPDELATIEDEVNRHVMSAEAISWKVLPLEEARGSGAMMLFGEKYPDEVRMVSMGDFSKELCGGTHLQNTGGVGPFKIIGEESVSAGTRRITALTGQAALVEIRQQQQSLGELAGLLKVAPREIPARVSTMAQELRDLKKQLASSGPALGVSADELLNDAQQVGASRAVVAEIPGGNPRSMRQLIDQLRRKAPPIAVLLAAGQGKKVVLVAGISRDLQAQGLSASDWIGPVAEIVDGRGGGRADMAQAGGKNPARLAEALELAKSSAKELLGG
jgi:alanyl-tRNA synthetase